MTTKKQQQGSLFSTENENAAATTPTTANSETALTTTNAATPATELDALSIEQLTMEAKFYYVQMGQNAVEFGKRLIAIKKKLPHGEWLNWLADNFQLKERSAQTFMQIAARFSNTQTFAHLGYSQLIQMLALPEGTEEDFIAEKAAEGKPVENMTIKQEREEIKKYKAKIEQLEKQVNFILDQNNQLADVARTLRHNLDASKNDILDVEEQNQKLQAENGRLQAKFDAADKLANQYHVERDILQEQLENQKPITVEPNDYQQLKKAKVQLQNKIDALQKQLANKPVEIVTPADYDETKKELARLQAEQSEMIQRMEVYQNLGAVAALMEAILKSPSSAGIQDFKREHPEEFGEMCANMIDFTNSYYEE